MNMMKEIIEDTARHQADKRVNHASTIVIRDGEEQTIQWRDVVVGDIVKILNNQHVPADILVLSSSGHRGICHIETSNLDGETNLKIRQAVEIEDEVDVRAVEAELVCEDTNNNLYRFQGALTVKHGVRDRQSNPLSFAIIVQR